MLYVVETHKHQFENINYVPQWLLVNSSTDWKALDTETRLAELWNILNFFLIQRLKGAHWLFPLRYIVIVPVDVGLRLWISIDIEHCIISNCLIPKQGWDKGLKQAVL